MTLSVSRFTEARICGYFNFAIFFIVISFHLPVSSPREGGVFGWPFFRLKFLSN